MSENRYKLVVRTMRRYLITNQHFPTWKDVLTPGTTLPVITETTAMADFINIKQITHRR